MKRILILLDYDLTLTEEFQQIPLITRFLPNIKTHYPTYKTLLNWQDGKPVWSPEKPVTEAIHYFKISDEHQYDVQQGLRWLQQFLWDKEKIFNNTLTRDTFVHLGKHQQQLSPNVIEGLWAIKNHWKQQDVDIRYHIISIGLKETMEASPINDTRNGEHLIDNIFAAEFLYDNNGHLKGIKKAPSPFDKTRAIIETVKGHPELLDTFLPHSEYQYDYQNIIVLGDGFSDISYFSYIREKGGIAVAVYKAKDFDAFKKTRTTIQDRADWLLPRDYNPQGRTITELNNIITTLINRTCDFDPNLLHQYRRSRIKNNDLNTTVKNHLTHCKECQGHHTLHWIPPA